jgi:hypothetical protein
MQVPIAFLKDFVDICLKQAYGPFLGMEESDRLPPSKRDSMVALILLARIVGDGVIVFFGSEVSL